MKTTFRITMLLAILLAMFGFAHAATVQVGDGTATSSFFPIFGNYSYSYTQQIYTQSQINFAGEITKLRFYYVSGDITNSKDWTIYLGHSDKTEFGSTTDWEAPANLTQVFNGDVTSMMPAANNWMEITLDTPFNYNNSNNLIVAVHQYTPDYATMSWGAFSAGSNKGMYYRDDNNNPDPNDLPTANGRSANINRIHFVFPDTEAPMTPVLLAPENGADIMSGQSLSWALPQGSADASGFDLFIDGNLVIDNQPTTSYTVTDLATGEHNWYVVARNNIGTSAPSETRTFNVVNGVIIGDGTSYQTDPFNAHYGYGRSIGLYSNAQIGQLGVITTLGWNVQTAGTSAIPYMIYAKITDDTELTQTTWADFTATATLVKEGSYTFNSLGWHQLDLDAPIMYTHGNLMIGVEANHGGSGAGTGGYPRFYYTSGDPATHQYWRRDNSIPDGNGTLNASRPNIMMLISPLSDDPTFVLSPSTWDFGRVMINTTDSKTFSIVNGGGGTLTVTGLSPMNDGFFTVTDAPTFPVSLTTGQSATFNIQYAPTTEGNHTGTFTITDGRATTDLVVNGECFDPSIVSFPYLQNFDGDWTGTPAAPEGWTVVNANDDGYTWRQSSQYISPTYSPPFAAHGMGNTDDWLITPAINLTNVNVRMKWWDKVESSTRANQYKVKVSTTTPDIASFTTDLLDVVCDNTAWTEHVLNLDAYNGQTIYLAFYQYVSPSNIYGFGIDDFLLEEIPAAPVFVYTPESIDFGTTFANTPTDYQNVTITNTGAGTLELTAANVSIVGDDAAMFEFDPVNLPLALTTDQSGVIPVRYNPTAEGTHSATLRMVYGGENYDVTLAGIAMGQNALFEGFEGTIFPPVGWTVHNGGGNQAWQRSTANPHSGVAHAHLRYDSVAHDDWLISPKLSPTAANHTFSFYGTNNSTYYDERFNVLVSTTTPDITSFTAIATNEGTGSNSYMFHSYDLSAYIGQQIYVAIQAISTNQLYLQIDDVSGPDIVAEMPAVPLLVSPADNAVMVSTTPTLVWDANPAGGVPTGYKVYLDANNPPTTEVADLNANSFTLTTPLQNNTVYYWTVKAYNSMGTTETATPFSFTTVPEGLVFIGDGTSNFQLPIYPYYNYSYSQTIYYQSDINVANQRIENLAFYWNGAAAGTNNLDWVIYMAHTDRTAFSGNQDWVPFDQLTTVYDGEVILPAEAGWVNITLQNPFVYNNTDNLLICVDENTPGNNGSTPHFYSTSVDGTRALLYYSDSTNPDPTSPPNANSQKSAFANIRMQFGDLPTTPIFTYTPQSIDFGSVTYGAQMGPRNVTITNSGSGTLNLPADAVSIIGPQAAEFSFGTDNLPMALGPGISATIPVFVTGTTEGPISATLRIVYDGENNDVALAASVLPEGTVFIGDGTSTQRQPFGTLWGFEHSAALYTADVIGIQGILTLIGWDCANTSSTDIPYKIWLKNTTATEITADSWTNFSADLTLVKEGNHSFSESGWNSFTLDTPFEYTGGNLIVATESAVGGSGGGTGHTFKYTSTPTSHGYWYSDNTFNPEQNCNVNANRPNLMLGFLTNTGNITGTVTGAGNQPLAGVSISLTERDYHTTTDDAGQYQLLNVTEGNYTMTFSKHGYQTHTQNVVLVEDDELVINVTMQLLPQVSVSGTVLASDTGAGIAGASITLRGYEDYSANTNASGAFTIPNVFANNVYAYNISAAGYVSENGQITLAATDYNMGQITLNEVAYAPAEVTAAANDAGTEVTIEWLAPDPNAIEVTEGFESTNFPPEGWTQVITNNGAANALGMYPTWCRIGAVTITGEQITPTEGSFQAAIAWAYTHQDEWLITPGFNCPPNAYMSFDSYVFMGSTEGDHYYVKVSTDNGENWTTLWDASAQTGGLNAYATPITIDLGAYTGNQVKVAFHAKDPADNSGLRENWFIDNVYIGNDNAKVVFDSDQFAVISASDKPARSGIDELSRTTKLPAKKYSRALVGYNVYRLAAGNEQNEGHWTLINQEPITALSIADPAWQTLANGDYRWAVKAVYTNNVLSVPSLSNTLNKFVETGMIIGTVRNKESAPISGATVTAGDYTATTNSMGAYSIQLPVGTYDVSAEADGFKSETREGVTVTANNNTTVNFILQPVSNDENTQPVVATALNGNYPNPFNPETTISYSVKEAGRVKLEVYNIKGQLVKTLVNQDQATGHYKLVFNAKDDRGRSISSGVYMLRMVAPGYQKTSKMILMQ